MNDIRFPYCIIPPLRNYQCPHYSECLSAHVDSTGWTCDGCGHYFDREPIDPAEGFRCIPLLVEIYGPSRVATVVRDMAEPEAPAAWKNGRFTQRLREVR